MKKKILLIVTAILFLTYFSSYILLRQFYTKQIEADGCPSEGCIEIVFPADGFYHIYRPLIGIDIVLMKSDFCNHGKGCYYSR